ncbi:MAG: ACT domain-containing protein [Candidatus Micrarchaeota archaeon]
MAGNSDLSDILKHLNPELAQEKFYFAQVSESQLFGLVNHLSYIRCICREEEGLSILFSEDIKEEMGEFGDEPVEGPFALITLKVNSSLNAVGMIAKVSEALAKEGIAVNVISACSHDYLLVPYEKRENALAALKRLEGA